MKRRDILVNWLVAILQIIHWFNPVLWFGFRRWRIDRELACDALALEAAGEGHNKEYGRTILRLLESFTHPMAAPGLVGILEDKRQLQQRISMIAAFVPNRRWSIPAAALLLALAAIGLTDASRATSSRPPEAVVEDQINKEIRNNFSNRAALMSTLQDQGLAYEEYRNKTRERVQQGFVQDAPTVSEALPSIHNPRLSEAVVEDQINREIRNNFSSRAALMSTLQDQGLTYEEYRNKTGERVEQRFAQAAPAGSEVLPAIHNPRPSTEKSLLQFRLVAEDGELAPVDELIDLNMPNEAAPKLRVLKETLLDETAVDSAELQASPRNGQSQIVVTLTDAGSEQLGRITEQNVSRRLAVIFDGELLLAPRINEKIVGKTMVISGSFTQAEGERIVAALNPDNRDGKSNQPPTAKAEPADRTQLRTGRAATTVLVQDGRLLLEMGKLDEAEAKLKEAFKREPENKAAAYYLNLINEVRSNQEARLREITAKERLAEVEDAWRTSITRDRLSEANPSVRTNLLYTGPGRKVIQHKLDTIRFEEVMYDGVPLSEVVKDVVAEARRRDPDKRGINVIVNSFVDLPASPQSLRVDPTTGNPLPASPPPEPLDLNAVIIRLALRDVSLGQLIEAITKFSEKPLRYSIEEYGIVFAPSTKGPESLFTRMFRVNPNTFTQGLQAVMAFPLEGGVIGSSSAGGGVGGQNGVGIVRPPTTNQMKNINDTVRRFFAAAGVDFPTNAGGFGLGGGGSQPVDHLGKPLTGTRKALFYNDRTGMIFARATQTDLDVMDRAIQVLNVKITPPQVMLEVKFVQLPPESPTWAASIENTNSHVIPVTGILTELQFQTLIHSFEARAGVDILAAPKVTTLGGRQARIELTELKSVVSGLADKTSGAHSTTNVLTGPSIDIIPDVLEDGHAIEMTVTANLTEFLGYDDPRSLSPTIAQEPLQPLPRFRHRKAMSTATVRDGQALMLGGFVSQNLRSMTNKVAVLGDIPLLGRLFRNESGSRTNKQLLVFVTPAIIDPAGNRVHSPDNDSSDATPSASKPPK